MGNRSQPRGEPSRSKADSRAISQIAAPLVAAAGFDLEALEIRKAGGRLLVRVLIDTDGGVTLDDAAEVARSLSKEFDERNPLGERAYVLDVGSPGVDRPLTLVRHWRRNIGRLVRGTRSDGQQFRGRILAVEGSADNEPPDAVELSVSDGLSTVRLMGTEIRRAVVQVEFSSTEESEED